jgi:hypothetical protein
MSPKERPGWIAWRNCVHKHIIMNDLQTGVLPIDAEEMLAEGAWIICYRHMAEFVRAGVVFDQFKERLQDHQKQVQD